MTRSMLMQMHRRALRVLACCSPALLVAGGARQDPAPAPIPATTAIPTAELRTRASYGIGLNVGRISKSQGVELDADAFMRGLRDGLSGAEAGYTDEQIAEALLAFQQQLMLKQEQILQEVGARMLRDGRAFLGLNATREGVTRLPSGLQYRELSRGDGPFPEADDTVFVRYVGKLPDGTVLEDSAAQGGVVAVPVGQVIPGWSEALQLMPVGSKWELVIPPDLAYGDEPPPGGAVPPNAVLVYEIELLGIDE